MPVLALDEQQAATLVRNAGRGDRSAADELVRAHDRWLRSVVYGVLGRSDPVDDVMQQVWTQVWQRLDTLTDPARLKPWLATTARNAAIDFGIANRRRASRTRGPEPLDRVPDPRGEADPSRNLERAELNERLLRAIQGLPAIYREPFALRHLEDWSYAEIGRVLDMPVETVETRLVRARRLLREALAGQV